ncbi:MAG: glycoside hydrolase family 27 protein [Lachnospiraceae bacterium]|nr:glycoside hydrolase family 27 protein [Lachnospiraceae bacterium]
MNRVDIKNARALTPPMGWNSYDYYNTSADEDDIKANADYMAKNLKKYGWEYVVVDIEWYSKHGHRTNDEYQYIPFEAVEIDGYGRLLPALERFPSSKGGKGFKPLADYIHSLGLKFGIHIMRGIPRIAAHNHLPVLGTDTTADKIAIANNICYWNPDMYGVNPAKPASQAYYDSIIRQYADWGVDFIKCDDICRMDMPTAEEEIKMLARAIDKCGRPIVLSLSPGAALIEKAWLYSQTANMWRITDDFWDNWKLLKAMFERCEVWEKQSAPGCWPDCDMLTIGKLGKWHKKEWTCNFTDPELKTMLSLWCIFRSPLMLGCKLPGLDKKTLKLITNEKILGLLKFPEGARQLARDDEKAIWVNKNNGKTVIALFNLADKTNKVSVGLKDAGVEGKVAEGTELWTGETVKIAGKALSVEIEPHGAAVVEL